MDRSTALNVFLLLLALSLFLGGLAFPPEKPPNQVEYRVEPIEEQYWDPPFEYENLTTAEREVFDAARDAPSGTHTVPVDDSPDELTPPPGGIDTYGVNDGNESYSLQVVHYNENADLLSEVVPWLAALVVGTIVGAIAAYRQFV